MSYAYSFSLTAHAHFLETFLSIKFPNITLPVWEVSLRLLAQTLACSKNPLLSAAILTPSFSYRGSLSCFLGGAFGVGLIPYKA